MIVGIDASRAFFKNRTGIEEYSYQVIKNLVNELGGHRTRLAETFEQTRELRRVVLYVRKNQEIDFKLPENWEIKVIKWPYFWTQIGLSLELLFHPVDVLFIPAHTVPIIHPRNTLVTIHGLEYEFYPEAYSFWERLYMRCVIKNSVKWAKKIIAVSENTKKDLMNLYKVPEEKIKVVYEGVNLATRNPQLVTNFDEESYRLQATGYSPYLLFIGRLEERKNICGIIDAYRILKEKYNIPHSLVLAGNPGFNYGIVKLKIENCKLKIIELGFVSEEEKRKLLENAEVFLFPGFYEGFGLPILEAQGFGVPVVTSNISSMPEVAGFSAILVNPGDSSEIAEAVYQLISDKSLRNDIINKGLENVKRFSWEKCSKEIGDLLKR
jgi:glycosyltransferase involved in cell wall biosynthesis